MRRLTAVFDLAFRMSPRRPTRDTRHRLVVYNATVPDFEQAFFRAKWKSECTSGLTVPSVSAFRVMHGAGPGVRRALVYDLESRQPL